MCSTGISQKSQNAVPDAVLNSTKCIVIVPSIAGKAANVSASAFMFSISHISSGTICIEM